MNSLFTSDFFAGNRQRLQELAGDSLVVLTANGLLQRGGDSTYPFEQDASFWYLTGISEPDVLLVMDSGEEYLIVPQRAGSRVAFDGAIDENQASQTSGIQLIMNDIDGWKRLELRLKQSRRVVTLGAAAPYIESHGFYTNPARAALATKLQAINSDIEFTDVSLELAQWRSVKQAPELAAIQQAIDITIATLQDITNPARLNKYQWEYELEADITQGFRRRGASGHAFDPIVAGGPRACTLHNVANNAQLKQGELIVLDVGAAVEHYAADITRTVVQGKPTKRQQVVYQAVLAIQAYAKSLLKPGVLMKEYEQQVEQFMGQKLQELGLIKEAEHTAIRHYYPHATSHFLGLNVHDSGDYTQPLQENMIVTVEPGIYIPEEGIGVRLEDDVLLTKNGRKVLSDALPRSLD